MRKYMFLQLSKCKPKNSKFIFSIYQNVLFQDSNANVVLSRSCGQQRWYSEILQCNTLILWVVENSSLKCSLFLYTLLLFLYILWAAMYLFQLAVSNHMSVSVYINILVDHTGWFMSISMSIFSCIYPQRKSELGKSMFSESSLSASLTSLHW